VGVVLGQGVDHTWAGYQASKHCATLTQCEPLEQLVGKWQENSEKLPVAGHAAALQHAASALCGPSSQATFCGVNVVNTSVLLIKMILHFCMCPAVLEGSILGISPLHSGCMPSLATTTAPWWLVANIVAIGGVAVQPNPPP
jgi:hypothetical protein